MPDEPGAGEHLSQPARFWRNRGFARVRHNLAHLRSLGALATRTHARIVVLSGGRITRSFLFTGRMPILVLTTTADEAASAGPPRSVISHIVAVTRCSPQTLEATELRPGG